MASSSAKALPAAFEAALAATAERVSMASSSAKALPEDGGRCGEMVGGVSMASSSAKALPG